MQARGRAGRRSSCSFERSLLRTSAVVCACMAQGPWIVAQLPTASGNTVLQPSWRPSDGQQIIDQLSADLQSYHMYWRWIYAYMAGHRTSTSLWLELSDSYTCEFGFVCQWWLLFSSFQCGYVASDLFFPFPKSNSASQNANDDWERPTSIDDLTAREPCRIFTFAKHVSFEHSTGIPCPVISSRRDRNINKWTKTQKFLDTRSSISQSASSCLCSGAPRPVQCTWAIWLAPRLSVATESTGTVLIPSQMSEIAGQVIRAVGRNLQFLHVWVSLREKSIVHRDGQACPSKIRAKWTMVWKEKIYLSRSSGERTLYMESSILRPTPAVQTTSVASTPQNVSGLAVGKGNHPWIFVDLRLCGDRSACRLLTPLSAPTVLTSSKLHFWHALKAGPPWGYFSHLWS